MIQALTTADLPAALRQLSSPPQQLYVRSENPGTLAELMSRRRVAIVGTRRISAYGLDVTARLASDLAARGVVIVSGLAIGVDAVAHRAALDAGGLCLAVLPTPVQQISPATNRPLARRLLENGGAIVSEYPEQAAVFKPHFVARNRIVAGLAEVLLITEATEGSGSLHTATFAARQGKLVLAVPGNITSPTSEGTNWLVRQGKAKAITGADGVFEALGITGRVAANRSATAARISGDNPQEQSIISLLEKGISRGAQLLTASGLEVEDFNHHLTMLEISAKVKPLGNDEWGLA